ncbi:MAG: hypothetical protein HUK20_09420, partial [Fibrobacter sp.]|nr:hypothetical protein [Fibrobacter sp.]
LNGKSPFDEAEERLEAGEVVNGKPKLPKAPVMGWQDGVFLLVVVGLIVGGYQYYQHTKKSCAEAFAACDALYAATATDASKYAEVEKCYESTWNLGFVSDSLEVLRQNRLGEIEDLRNANKDAFDEVNEALDKGDSATAMKVVSEYKGPVLLYGDDKAEWDKLKELAKNVDASEPTDSTLNKE